MKKFTFVLAALAAAMFSFAQETVVKELDTTGSLTGSNNSYAGNCDVVADEVTWNFTGNSQMNPWRLGGKSLTATDRTVYTKTDIADDVTKVEVVHGAASDITVNSFKMLVASAADFSDAVSYDGTFTASATATFTRPEGTSWANKYYKFVYNVTVTDAKKNKFVEFKGVKFYAIPAAANVAAPVLTAEEGKVTDGNFTEAFTLTMTCATEGASIFYTLDGTDPAESETAVEYTAAITIPAKSTKVRAIAMDGTTAEFSREATATYCYVNTAATAYTATEAIAVIDAGLGLNNKLYVKGSIKSITELSTQYGNATYVITDGTSDLTIFRGKYLEGEKFTSEDQLTVGDEVVVYGLLKLYGETYEMDSNNELVSLTPGTGSRIDNATEAVKAVKVIENGQMVIIRGGVKYNAQGVVIE